MDHNVSKSNARCALCLMDNPLRDSHIIPKYVINHIKEFGNNPGLRSALNPNKRVQDGLKIPLLCNDCEQLIGRFENYFKSTMFIPFLKDQSRVIEYRKNLLLFCSSISWRTILYRKSIGSLSKFNKQDLELVERSSERLRLFLMGREKSPGCFEQYIFPLASLSNIEALPVELPININQAIHLSTDVDIVNTSHDLFTYSQLGPILICGLIRTDRKKYWDQKMRIRLNKGLLSGKNMTMNGSVFYKLINVAECLLDAQTKLSERQINLIHQKFEKYISK